MIPLHLVLRIAQILEHIEENIGHHGTFEEIAAMAMLSKYYFSHVFKEVVGESYAMYVFRQKMEMAYRLIRTDPSLSINDLSMQIGYKSNSNFSNAFFRTHGIQPNLAKKLQTKPIKRDIDKSFIPNIQFKGICSQPKRFVIYRKILTGYCANNIRNSFSEIYAYSKENNMEVMEVIGILHHDPDYTKFNQCYYDACLVVPVETIKKIKQSNADFPYNKKWLSKNSYACYDFVGKAEEIQPTWDYIIQNWSDESNYMITTAPRMELLSVEDDTNADRLHVTLCLPIKQTRKLTINN